jgi:hypothetical protein
LIYIILFSLLSQDYANAQDEVDFQTWIDLTTVHNFNSKWVYTGDYGFRGVVSGEDWSTFIVRPTFRYRITPILDVRAGVALFYTLDKVIDNNLELRFHQEVDVKWPEIVGMVFKHRVRFEERFFFYEELENEFSARVRYRLYFETPDFKIFKNCGPFFGMTSIEFFLDLGEAATERFVSRNRIELGLGHRTSKKFRWELHYIWQNSKTYANDNFKTSENIFRLRFFLITFKKDKAPPVDGSN